MKGGCSENDSSSSWGSGLDGYTDSVHHRTRTVEFRRLIAVETHTAAPVTRIHRKTRGDRALSDAPTTAASSSAAQRSGAAAAGSGFSFTKDPKTLDDVDSGISGVQPAPGLQLSRSSLALDAEISQGQCVRDKQADHGGFTDWLLKPRRRRRCDQQQQQQQGGLPPVQQPLLQSALQPDTDSLLAGDDQNVNLPSKIRLWQQQQQQQQAVRGDPSHSYDQLTKWYQHNWMGATEQQQLQRLAADQTKAQQQRQQVAAAVRQDREAIMTHFRKRELKNRPNPHYMSTVQTSLDPSMRCILINWLVGFSQDLNLKSDTLFLSVQLLDRYLSFERVTTNSFQLLGVTCLWIAAKFEEVDVPPCRHLVNSSYGKQEIMQMEQQVLTVLHYRLAAPTARTFQRYYLHTAAAAADGANSPQQQQIHYLAAFLLELSLLEYSLLRYLPSQLAAGSVYLARFMLGHDSWTSSGLAHVAGYEEFEIGFIAYELALNHARILGLGFSTSSSEPLGMAGYTSSGFSSPGQRGFCVIRNKYSSRSLLCVSEVPSRLREVQERLWPGNTDT